MYLIFDTETTGLPKRWDAPFSDTDNWPRVVQIAWQLHNELGELVEQKDYLIQPDNYTIPYNAEEIHGISTSLAQVQGVSLQEALEEFNIALAKTKFIVGQNLKFDTNVVGCEFTRLSLDNQLQELPVLDTCTEKTAQLCQIPGGRGGKFKLPKLGELHQFLFSESFSEAHNATADVEATTRCFFELMRQRHYSTAELQTEESYFTGFLSKNPNTIQSIGLKHLNLKKESAKIKKQDGQTSSGASQQEINKNLSLLADLDFVHLHCHTQFSILQSTASVNDIVEKAKALEMPAIAMTDHANMMGAFHFVRAADKAGIKGIVGCEFNICDNRLDKKRQNNGSQNVILAKNKKGYHNLVKLASYANIEGFYYVPRIDRELLLKYKGELIVTTGGINGDVPSTILNIGEEAAEKSFIWWKENFGDDFYVEINRHGIKEENIVNEVLLRFAKKYNVKLIASNNTYYVAKEDAKSHDLLLCVRDAANVSTPKKYIGRPGRDFRYGFPNDEFYIKSADEMKKLFADIPDAIINTVEVADKCEPYLLAQDVLLPAFEIPEEFKDPKDLEDPKSKIGENAYLRHITYEGAKKRYPEITDEIKERLDFELQVISNSGYPGYFLIVEDFIREARRMGVSVGPGRGSAAGSAVAYCVEITNIDPIAYDLLFERFLNPERVSMPDIDIDFDDEGRQKVIDYVINKYGSTQVAQIITYGTMAAKSSIRDVSRVLELPLGDADRLAKLIPDTSLSKIFGLDDKALATKLKNNQEDIARANELKALSQGNGLEATVINQARKLEGTVRNTGIHACGVIITPEDITNYVPVALAKDSEMCCTQFDNSVAEDAGLLKMDFLGLKTLTLIKDACKNVKERHNIDLNPDTFPIDDEKTYGLFQRGETVGIFQYESAGMQKYMRELKPTVFADLIAMNALYRPGPIEYIPSFIKRKHGEEEIVYDLDACKEYLEETYGITVYQEQVMLLSQSLAGFSKGEADVLRKAMGKKLIDVLAKMKPKFITQASEKGHDPKQLEKIWKDWEAFASYAFNKSHSTCYAWIAYQTAYLKANYPAEYMASVLSNNMNDIKSVTFFMEECKRMKMPVLGPDLNESNYKFTVNQKGEIRFGLGAIKGTGANAVAEIVKIRKEKGLFSDIFEFSTQVNLRTVNKKTLECLSMAGAFDQISDYHRRQYIEPASDGSTLLEKIVKYGQKMQAEKESAQVSLFGGSNGMEIPKPKVEEIDEYSEIERLNIEKEVVGLYITGHPLDSFKIEIENFCRCTIKDVAQFKNKEISVGGIVTSARQGQTKNGKPFGVLSIEDYTDKIELFMLGNDYLEYAHFFSIGQFVYVKGRMELNWRKGKELKENPQLFITDDDYDLRTSSIELLSDVKEKLCKGLKLKIDVESLDSTYIHNIKTLISNHPGEHLLKIDFIEYKTVEVAPEEKEDGLIVTCAPEKSKKTTLKVETVSRRHTVDVSNDLLQKIEHLNGIEYEILT